MSVQEDVEEGGNWREILAVVREAEELAYSEEWRSTAKTMRLLRRQMQEFNLFDSDSMQVRFRIAHQIFMDRRADFYEKGNRKKGAHLQGGLAALQKKAGELRESIQFCRNTIKEYHKKRDALFGDPKRQSIENFIDDSCKEVNTDIENKTARLLDVEKEIVMMSTRYCSVE